MKLKNRMVTHDALSSLAIFLLSLYQLDDFIEEGYALVEGIVFCIPCLEEVANEDFEGCSSL